MAEKQENSKEKEKEEVPNSAPIENTRTDDELKVIAVDLYDGKIFSDRHMRDENSLLVVFMPIAFGAFNNWTKERLDTLGIIYEYLSEAGPRSVNGMPTFMSFRLLNREETEKMFVHYEAYKKMKEEFIGKPEDKNKKENG